MVRTPLTMHYHLCIAAGQLVLHEQEHVMHFVDACPAIDFNASEPRYCCRLGPALTKGVSALPLRLRETP